MQELGNYAASCVKPKHPRGARGSGRHLKVYRRVRIRKLDNARYLIFTLLDHSNNAIQVIIKSGDIKRPRGREVSYALYRNIAEDRNYIPGSGTTCQGDRTTTRNTSTSDRVIGRDGEQGRVLVNLEVSVLKELKRHSKYSLPARGSVLDARCSVVNENSHLDLQSPFAKKQTLISMH